MVTYGNGVSTQTEFYTAPRRLKRTHTSTATTNLQDITYTYDKVSNVKSVTDAVHGGASSCSLSNIQYDDLHRLTSLYSTAEGRTITYTYNALDNTVTNGEMGTGAYTYSPIQPHAVEAANGSTYSYDGCGNMITRNRSGQPNQTLTYDEENRLKQVAITGGSTIQFGYAAGGARLWKKVNGQITGLWIGSLYEEKNGKVLCHVYAGGQLVATFEPESGFACLIENNRYLAAVWHFGDDVLTGLFGGGRAPLSGLALALLTGLFVGRGPPSPKPSEDGLPDAMQRWEPSLARSDRSVTLPLWRRVVITGLVGSVLITSVPTEAYAGTPVYDPVFYYYHADHLGSSQVMTDRDGDVVQQYGYSPFGRENYKNNTQAFSVSNRYTGQILDEETGLYYYGARYYDPELARFIQADSVVPAPASSQALNRYAYCYNNPLRLTDPTGHTPTDMWSLPDMTLGDTSWAGTFSIDWGFNSNGLGLVLSSGSSSTALTLPLTGNPGSAGGGGGYSTRGYGPSGGWSDEGDNSRNQYSGFDYHGATWLDKAGYVMGQATAQTLANYAQGFQNMAIDGVNFLIAGVFSVYNEEDIIKGDIIPPAIPKSQWAKNRWVSQSDFSYNVETVAGPTAILWGTGAALEAATAPRGLALARQLGQAGEDAVGITGPKVGIRVPGSNRMVFPDRYNQATNVLDEVKNVASLSNTRQLRGYTAITQQSGGTFNLWVRPSTQMSWPLEQQINNKLININYIPGTR